MKQIASLMLTSICLLALAAPVAAAETRWGWSEVEHAAGMAGLEEHPARLLRFADLAGPVTSDVTIVSVNVDPKTTKVPGVLANVWPKIKDALDAVRKAVTGDPTLKASLDSRGIPPNRVVGIGESQNGRLTVFVSNAA